MLVAMDFIAPMLTAASVWLAAPGGRNAGPTAPASASV